MQHVNCFAQHGPYVQALLNVLSACMCMCVLLAATDSRYYRALSSNKPESCLDAYAELPCGFCLQATDSVTDDQQDSMIRANLPG